MAQDTETAVEKDEQVAEQVEGQATEAAASEPAPAADDAAEKDAAPDDVAEPEDDEDDSEDSLTYSNGVIEKIVAMATRTVPHVLGMKGNLMHFVQEQFGAENLAKGVTVEVTDDNRVLVHISVIIEYGSYAPAIFDDVKAAVSQALEQMTGLEVAGINLRIEDVITREEYEAKRHHSSDHTESADEE